MPTENTYYQMNLRQRVIWLSPAPIQANYCDAGQILLYHSGCSGNSCSIYQILGISILTTFYVNLKSSTAILHSEQAMCH